MIGLPKTKAEAKQHRYNRWAGNPKGMAYDEERCANEVSDSCGFGSHQCTRRPGFGPGELYCRVHAKMIAR